MSGIQSFSQLPIANVKLVNEQGIIDNVWHLFFQNLASGVRPSVINIPVNGFSFIVPDGVVNVILDPAGVLATGTLVMPKNPSNGQEVKFTTSQTITACTFSPNSGQTMVNAPTTLTAGTPVIFNFQTSSAKWYKA